MRNWWRNWQSDIELGVSVGIGATVVFLAVMALIAYSAAVNH